MTTAARHTTNPATVRLNPAQADLIEHIAETGGRLHVPHANMRGSNALRVRAEALRARGILGDPEHTTYESLYQLTEYGWAVYNTHDSIIRR